MSTNVAVVSHINLVGRGKGKHKRGRQPRRTGHSRKLDPLEAYASVIKHHPETRAYSGELLFGEDSAPYWHQIDELPPIDPTVIEHCLHVLTYKHFGEVTRSRLPAEVCLSAVVALLSGAYRQGHQQVKTRCRLCQLMSVKLHFRRNPLKA